MRIVLLNPPGEKIFVRNYYCGSTSKSGYLFQPIDLLMLSGGLAAKHEIKVIDCIAEKLSTEQAIRKISAFSADAVVCLVSMVSWKGDNAFLKSLKKAMALVKIVANGDVFFDDPEKTLSDNPWIDAVIFDFISDDLNAYFSGDENTITNMIYRSKGGIVLKRVPAGDKIFTLPVPRHELFMHKNYRFPFARRYPLATVITTFGCPFRCSFCIANVLGFRYRRAAQVMDELRYILRLKVKEIFFEDMSFGVPRENIMELCKMMIAEKLDLSWTCFSRVDIVDSELLFIMKQAGCHTIIFGVESGSEDILKVYNKDLNKTQILAAFKACRKIGINTVATFILGFPQDTEQSCLETIKFSKEIDCDYASFNIAVPRPGTVLRRDALTDNTIKNEDLVFDHSGATVRSIAGVLSGDKLSMLRKRAVHEFYFRPAYILRRIISIKSFHEVIEHCREFFWLIMQNSEK